MIAVTFEVVPYAHARQRYLALAADLAPLLAGIDGFVSIERFQSLSQPEKILSLSFWRDEEAVRLWRNFVKPVQDALCALIYADDSMIRDVSAHMRIADVKCDTEGLPEKLAQAICAGQVCVYVAISDSRELAEEVK